MSFATGAVSGMGYGSVGSVAGYIGNRNSFKNKDADDASFDNIHLKPTGSNDIINTNDIYYQRRETGGPQGRYNGNGNEQSGENIESADTVRTEGYKFRDGKDYKESRAGLWQKAYGRVSGTLKKTSAKYIRHGNRAIMFSEYDNAKSVIRQKNGSVVFYIEFWTDIYYNY